MTILIKGNGEPAYVSIDTDITRADQGGARPDTVKRRVGAITVDLQQLAHIISLPTRGPRWLIWWASGPPAVRRRPGALLQTRQI